jgi:ABC transport system ATP-binding/permease protein
MQPGEANQWTGNERRIVRIGRADDNDVVLDYPMVSAHHAQLVIEPGRITVEDLHSSNGTRISSADGPVSRATLSPADVVYFGSLRVPVHRLLSGRALLGQKASPAASSLSSTVVFGRDESCDQVIDHPVISRRHARLIRVGGEYRIEDFGSSNGTFLNGRKINGPTPVRPRDRIGLGDCLFQLTEDGRLEKRDFRGNVTLEAQNVAVDVRGRRLLEGVSLTIFPSEFVGLMGPSGAGKTTLMTALNGYARPSAGHVLLNGDDLYANYNQFRSRIGYVPQDDIIHRELTVYQALFYTARLRLPADYSREDIHSRIVNVLEELGLKGTENLLIGSPETKKGISGGQRKRANLAMELLTDPSLLFLDEPTSGLSSGDTLVVMRLLRKLADRGKTILLTIHQPSLDAFRLLDNLVFVARDQAEGGPGNLVYYGPAHPGSAEFFHSGGVVSRQPGVDLPPEAVEEGYREGCQRHGHAEWLCRYRASAYYREYVELRSGRQMAERENEWPRKTKGFVFSQWLTLTRRGLAIKAADRWNTLILLTQAPIIGTLISAVFANQDAGPNADAEPLATSNSLAITLFLLVLSALWFGCSNAVREIVGEAAIYRRERMVGLSLGSYIAAKFTVLAGLCILQCAILLGLVALNCDLQGSLSLMFGLLLVLSLVGVAIGLVLSATAKTTEVAIAMLPIVLLAMVMLGGLMLPLHKMSPTVRVAANLMPSRWGFEAMLLVENKARTPFTVPVEPPLGERTAPPTVAMRDWADDYFPAGSHRAGVAPAVGALFAMLLACCAAIVGMLQWRHARRRSNR